MEKIVFLIAIVLAFAVVSNAVTVSYTVTGWGPNQYPSETTPPPEAPWGPDGYPGDTLEMVTYTGSLDLAPGTYTLKINTLKWTIDYTYGGTETDPDDWSNIYHNITVVRSITFDGGPSGSLSQDMYLENEWENDFLTVYEGITSTFSVGGCQVEVTPLGISRFGGSNFSGDAPWPQPDNDIFARFEVAPPEEVWVDDDYCEGCANDGHTWGSDAFDVIQDGIDAVAESGTVHVAAGQYELKETFPIVIDKTIDLLGPQANIDPRSITCGGRTGAEAVIDANELSSAVVQISASDVNINGFTITGATGDMVEEDGSADNLMFQYNIIYDDPCSAGDEAIQIKYSDGVIMQYNYAYNILQDAFNLSVSSNGSVRYNEAHDIKSENAAIYCYETTNIDIIGNLVYNVPNNDAIKLGDSDDGSIGGIVSDNETYNIAEDGITIYAAAVTVQNNNIYNCDSENGAMYLYGANDSVVTDNHIHDNDAIGLLIANSSNITVEYNRIYDCCDTNDDKYSGSAGIWLTEDANTPTIDINYNIIYNNADFGIRNDNATNVVNAENNCWADPNGPTHPSNPNGRGDVVSDDVDFDPWLSACCGDPDNEYPVADVTGDCNVNLEDYTIFASAWLSNRCGPNWNPDCNLESSDDIIDLLDLGIFAANWLACTDPDCN